MNRNLASLAPEAVVIKHFSATAPCPKTAPSLFPNFFPTPSSGNNRSDKDDFARLLEKPVELAEDPEVANWNPAIEHDPPSQVKRYMELMANIDKLTAEEEEEFAELMNIVAVDEVPKDEGLVLRFTGQPAAYAKIITALTRDKLIHRALCHLGNIPNGATFTVGDNGHAFDAPATGMLAGTLMLIQSLRKPPMPNINCCITTGGATSFLSGLFHKAK
jgi:hypothetical protein